MGFPGGLEALDGRCVVVLLEELHARVEMGHGRFEEQVLGPHVAVQDGLERVPGKVEGLQVAVSAGVCWRSPGLRRRAGGPEGTP